MRCVVHALGAGPRALERRAAVVGVLVVAVEEGRGEARRGEVAPLSGEGVVGAVLAVLHTRLSERGAGPALGSELVGGGAPARGGARTRGGGLAGDSESARIGALPPV